MINRTTKAILVAIFTLHFSASGFAGQALEAINAEVEQTSAAIDQQYGVLLDTQERIDLKLALIAKKAVGDLVSHHKTLAQAAQTAFEIFEIVDPDEQRQLLVKIQSTIVSFTGSTGNDPDYP